MHGTKLNFHVVAPPLSPNTQMDHFIGNLASSMWLPRKLRGDRSRLQQVLVNLIKYCLKECRGKPVQIFATYDQDIAALSIQVINEGKGFDLETFEKMQTLLSKSSGEIGDSGGGQSSTASEAE